MSYKNKIENYVKGITKNDTYSRYLTDAALFGYKLTQDEIKALKAELKAFEDIGEPIEIDNYNDNDFSGYVG